MENGWHDAPKPISSINYREKIWPYSFKMFKSPCKHNLCQNNLALFLLFLFFFFYHWKHIWFSNHSVENTSKQWCKYWWVKTGVWCPLLNQQPHCWLCFHCDSSFLSLKFDVSEWNICQLCLKLITFHQLPWNIYVQWAQIWHLEHKYGCSC